MRVTCAYQRMKSRVLSFASAFKLEHLPRQPRLRAYFSSLSRQITEASWSSRPTRRLVRWRPPVKPSTRHPFGYGGPRPTPDGFAVGARGHSSDRAWAPVGASRAQARRSACPPGSLA
jgi:hypothetical protein